MTLDRARIRDFARSYTEAWCNHDPTRVADHFVTGGTIAINGGEPTEITEVARSFISEFPDIQVFMDNVAFNDETVEYHWTFAGTNTGPGGTGNQVRISGFEVWTFGDDGLVVQSEGHYDQDDYDARSSTGRPSHSRGRANDTLRVYSGGIAGSLSVTGRRRNLEQAKFR